VNKIGKYEHNASSCFLFIGFDGIEAWDYFIIFQLQQKVDFSKNICFPARI
jgi:hypothetical protein